MQNYDFGTLSPADFELLSRDLLKAKYGWELEAFGHGADGGIDLRAVRGRQKTIVQCKHYRGSSVSQLRAALALEKPKMLIEKPTRYLVVTSRDLTRGQVDKVAADLEPLVTNTADVVTRKQLNQLLAEFPVVEKRHFKLWLASSEVLAQIVNSGIWSRSQALLEDIRDRVRLYVSNPSYERASKLLDARRIVVISGPPGVGKSLLAEMLLLSHWNEGWEVVQVGADIEEAWDAWKPQGRQIFLYDDFLGQTSLGENLGKNEDSRISKFADLVAKRADRRFVLTTRTQILIEAAQRHEPIKRAGFDLATCEVVLDDYSPLDRARILYNHLYFGRLPRRTVRGFIRQAHYMPIISHRNFSPRIIEQVLKRRPRGVRELVSDLTKALDNPVELWGPTFENGLTDDGRRLLLTLATFAPSGVSVTALCAASGVTLSSHRWNQMLKALEGTWVALAGNGRSAKVSFADPSCRDFVLAFMEEHPDELTALILHFNDVEQISLVGSYARTRVLAGGTGTAKYPNVRRALRESPSLMGAALTRLASVLPCATWSERETALTQIATFPSLEGFVDVDLPEIVFSAVVRVLGAGYVTRGGPHVSAAVSLTRWVGGLASGTTARNRRAGTALGHLLTAASDSMTDLAEATEIFDLASDLNDQALPSSNWPAMVVDAMVAVVEDDLSNLTSMFSEPDDMRNHISEAESFSERYGFFNRIAYRLDTAEETVDDYESRHRSAPRDLTPRESLKAVVRASAKESQADTFGEIRAMFAELG